MDPLAALLDTPRARDAFLLRASMAPPWALRIQDEAALTVVAMTRGTSVFERAGEVLAVGTGDVVLLTGRTPYVVADEAGRAPFAVVQPGNRPESPDGEPLSVPLTQGIRRWGNSADGPDEMLVGNYGHVGEAGRRLLSVLPETVVLRADEWRSRSSPCCSTRWVARRSARRACSTGCSTPWSSRLSGSGPSRGATPPLRGSTPDPTRSWPRR